VETYKRAQDNELNLIRLTKRINQRPLPEITIADMRREVRRGNNSAFSTVLKEELERCLANGNQAILFLNRRGYSQTVVCSVRHFGELLYLFMDANGLLYDPRVGRAWADSMEPSLSHGEFSTCRRVVMLLEQSFLGAAHDLRSAGLAAHVFGTGIDVGTSALGFDVYKLGVDHFHVFRAFEIQCDETAVGAVSEELAAGSLAVLTNEADTVLSREYECTEEVFVLVIAELQRFEELHLVEPEGTPVVVVRRIGKIGTEPVVGIELDVFYPAFAVVIAAEYANLEGSAGDV
jgi:hypothetical protein